MRMTCVCVGAVCAAVAGGAFADDGPDEALRERTGGLLTAESFQPYAEEAEVYGSGPYPSVYVRGAAALVFPFDTEVETMSFGDDLELNSKIGVGLQRGRWHPSRAGPEPR